MTGELCVCVRVCACVDLAVFVRTPDRATHCSYEDILDYEDI